MTGHVDSGAPARVVPQDFDVAPNARGEVCVFYRFNVDSPFTRARRVRLAGRFELILDDGSRVVVGRLPWRSEQAARESGLILLVGVGGDGKALAADELDVEGAASNAGAALARRSSRYAAPAAF